jgi:hypothetical protein
MPFWETFLVDEILVVNEVQHGLAFAPPQTELLVL